MFRWGVLGLLGCIFFLSLIMNSAVLEERLVNDMGWHSSIAREFSADFPNIPGSIPLVRQGVKFTYPPLSFLFAAALKHAFPDVRLAVLMRYAVLFFISASVFPVYLLAARIFRERSVGICAAFLFALSPLPFAYYQYSQSVAFPFVLASLFFLFRALDEGSLILSAISGVFLGIGYWTHLVPSFFMGAVMLAVSLFYGICRNFRLSRVSVLAVFVSLPFLLLYLAKLGLISDIGASAGMSRLSVIFIPGKFAVIYVYLYERFLLLFFGIAGLGMYLRMKAKSPLLLLFLFISLGLALAGYGGFYFFAVPLVYIRFLFVALCLFGGFALSRVWRAAPGWRGVFVAVFFVYSAYVGIVTGGNYVGMSGGDVAAFSWMRENFEPGAVVSADNAHAFWIPFAANLGTINGRKLDEFYVDSRDIDVAWIFSAPNPTARATIMAKYGSRYVFYSNDSLKPYPRIRMEDRWGEEPAWLVWSSGGNVGYVFGKPPFRRLYSDPGADTVAIYEA